MAHVFPADPLSLISMDQTTTIERERQAIGSSGASEIRSIIPFALFDGLGHARHTVPLAGRTGAPSRQLRVGLLPGRRVAVLDKF